MSSCGGEGAGRPRHATLYDASRGALAKISGMRGEISQCLEYVTLRLIAVTSISEFNSDNSQIRSDRKICLCLPGGLKCNLSQ